MEVLFVEAFLSGMSSLFRCELLFRIWDAALLEISKKGLKLGWILIAVVVTLLRNIEPVVVRAKRCEDVELIITA